MHSAVECSGSGHVHVHLLVYGPYLPKELVEAIVRQVDPMAGFVWIEKARTDEKGLAREVAKYQTKGPSPMSEGWLAGETREVMDPTLVACWELATMGAQLSRVYGALRGKKPKKDEEEKKEPTPPPENPCAAHCEQCGTVGEITMIETTVQTFVALMHAQGKRALRGSRWKPREPSPPDSS